jgi:hypothetical protein
LLDDLLDPERYNAANSRILDKNTTIIYVRKRVGDSHDVSKPAKYWEWADCVMLEVPTGDPQDIVSQRMKMFWEQRRLKPHDSNLRRLEYEDCYKAAKEDEHHTLYMMKPSQQSEEEKAAENTVSLIPPLSIPLEMLHWPPPSMPLELIHWSKGDKRRRRYASRQAQERTGLEDTSFVAPPDIPSLPPNISSLPPNIPSLPPQRKHQKHQKKQKQQKQLVKSTGDVHRDKIGRGPNEDNDGEKIQKRVGMSFQEKPIRVAIRKDPKKMRRI